VDTRAGFRPRRTWIRRACRGTDEGSDALKNVDTPHSAEPSLVAELQAKLAATEAKLTESQVEIRQLTAQRDAFRNAYERTRIELVLLKRIFVGTAERFDTTQLRLEFAEKAQAFEARGRPSSRC
jgi:hypothetical protein